VTRVDECSEDITGGKSESCIGSYLEVRYFSFGPRGSSSTLVNRYTVCRRTRLKVVRIDFDQFSEKKQQQQNDDNK